MYNPDALKSAVAGIDCPEFLPKSANPFYCIPTGSQSPYGDQLINMLESLVASKGEHILYIQNTTNNHSLPSYPEWLITIYHSKHTISRAIYNIMHLKLYTVASSSKLATDFYLCINAIDALINTHM